MQTNHVSAWASVVAIALAMFAPTPSFGQSPSRKTTTLDSTQVDVPISGSLHFKTDKTITRISVAASDIADVAAFPPNEVLITGKGIGTTNATIWYGNDIEVVRIRVMFPLDAIRTSLRNAVPGSRDLDVKQAGSSLVLTGEVPTAHDIEAAESIVAGHLAAVGNAGKLVNMLRVGGDHQVQLEVAFSEVSRSSLREIGLNFWASKGKAAGGLLAPTTGVDALVPDGAGASALGVPEAGAVPLLRQPLGSTFGAIFSSVLGDFPFSAALSLLSNKGYARVLAEPTLVAMSGEDASFLAGGEFPIPIPQGLGTVGVEFKKFGVQVKFSPTVIGDTIQLAVSTTASDIDFSLGLKLAGVTVPGLTERHASSTVRLRDGQSFVLAGLLSDRVRSSVDKVPWLGELPVLGALFRSSSYRREETELLVVVTVHLVRPLGERPELPGERDKADPNDLELFLLGQAESRTSEPARSPAGNAPANSNDSKRSPKRIPAGAIGFKR